MIQAFFLWKRELSIHSNWKYNYSSTAALNTPKPENATQQCLVRLASCASSCAAVFCSLLTWLISKAGSIQLKSKASWMTKWRKDLYSADLLNIVATVEPSVSRIAFWLHHSVASAMPSRAASASNSAASRAWNSARQEQSKTFPSLSLMTTPKPAAPVYESNAPSTLIFIKWVN